MEELRRPQPEEREEIGALLAACGLPHDDLDAHLRHFTIARDGGRIVGVIGLEVHGADGLMRSLAVAEDHRGRGVARRLYAVLLGEATRLGLSRLFLVAPTALTWFTLLGFRPVPDEGPPESIRRAAELRGPIPAGAQLIVRTVPRA